MGATGDVEQPRGPGGAERGGPEPGDAGAAGQLVPKNPWNLMIKHRQVQRRGRRSQMTTSFTDPSISMDLLRAVLQPSINEEIQTVLNKYMKFFQKAALNVQENVGEEVDAEQLIQEACRSCLEQVRPEGAGGAGTGLALGAQLRNVILSSLVFGGCQQAPHTQVGLGAVADRREVAPLCQVP